jgi:hypothetical protein
VTLFFSATPGAPNGRKAESQLESDIPASHPHKTAIEETLREMTQLPGGPWRVEVRPARAYDWWFVHIVAEGCGFKHTMALGPEHQNPEVVRAAWTRAWLGFETSAKEVAL